MTTASMLPSTRKSRRTWPRVGTLSPAEARLATSWPTPTRAPSSASAFGATYLADDANSYSVSGVGALEGVGPFAFGGAHAPYDEQFPDAFSLAWGGPVVLRYDNALPAAVGISGKAVVVGFGLELVEPLAERQAAIAALRRFVAPGSASGNPPLGSQAERGTSRGMRRRAHVETGMKLVHRAQEGWGVGGVTGVSEDGRRIRCAFRTPRAAPSSSPRATRRSAATIFPSASGWPSRRPASRPWWRQELAPQQGFFSYRLQTAAGPQTLDEHQLLALAPEAGPLAQLRSGSWDSPEVFALRQEAVTLDLQRRGDALGALFASRVTVSPTRWRWCSGCSVLARPRFVLADEVGLGKTGGDGNGAQRPRPERSGPAPAGRRAESPHLAVAGRAVSQVNFASRCLRRRAPREGAEAALGPTRSFASTGC